MPPEEDVGRSHVVEGLMVPMVVVVLNELADRLLQIPRIVVMLELDGIVHRTVVALDLSLRHRMVRRSTRVLDPKLTQIFSYVVRDVAGVTSRNGKNRTLRPIERQAGPELALFNLLVQPPAMVQSIVGKELIGWDMLELAFRVRVEAAHPDAADAVTVHGVLLNPVCQEELYNPGRDVSINPK